MSELITKLGIDWKLLLANAVTFLIVLWVLRKYAYGPIMRVLDQRQKTIAGSLAKAKLTDEEYQKLQDAKEQMLKEAKQEAQGLVHQAEVEASTWRQAELQKTQNEATQLVAKTRQQLERERLEMVAKAKGDLAELVTTATEKVLGNVIDPELEQKLQKQVVKTVKQA